MYFIAGSSVGENNRNTPLVDGECTPTGGKSICPLIDPGWSASARNLSRSPITIVACIVSVVPAARPATSPADGSLGPRANPPAITSLKVNPTGELVILTPWSFTRKLTPNLNLSL